MAQQTNKQYDAYTARWDIMRVTIEGNDADGGDLIKYLLCSFKDSKVEAEKERYKIYAGRAIYTNYTFNTVDGMRGMMTRLAPPKMELPTEIEYMLTDWDGGGQDIDQLIKRTFTQELSVGRIGGLTEYPSVEKGMSQEEVSALGLKATITLYWAETILDWDEVKKNGKTHLIMVKLLEIAEVWEGNTRKEEKQYRVLRFDESGYSSQLFDEEDNPITEQIHPTQSDGSKWDHIPFHFCGSEDNTPTVDNPPIYSIARLNLGHYRNSADNEENLFIAGQGTFVLNTGDVTIDQFKEANPNGVSIGARGAIAGPGFEAEMLQVEANGALPTAMDKKVEQMVEIGASIIREDNVQRTAKAETLKASGKTSKLGTMVKNAEHFIVSLFQDAALYMGGNPDQVEVELNRDFYDESMDAQQLMALIALKGAGVMAATDIIDKLKKVDIVSPNRTNEEIIAEAESEPGMGVV